jgi:NAD+ kinase
MKVAIYGKKFKKIFYTYAYELFKKLNDNNVEIIVYKPFFEFMKQTLKFTPEIKRTFIEHNEINETIDFVFSIGGDGTFLETITFVRDSGVPIVGINSGRLGFLANISKQEIPQALDKIFDKQYTFQERKLIELKTSTGLFGDFNFAMNELSIHKRDTSSMIKIHTYMNEEYLNTYWADGLLISTPTGSTAYSLSVGGPIVLPASENFIISPIAPHNLTVRPLVIPDKCRLKLKVEGRGVNYLASLDSRTEIFNSSLELQVKKADFNIKMLQLEGKNFFTTLRNKLMWGVDKRN